jgi:hypothetical protein
MDTSTHGPIDDLPDHLAFAWLDRASVTRTRATTRARYRSNGGTEYEVMVGGHRSTLVEYWEGREVGHWTEPTLRRAFFMALSRWGEHPSPEFAELCRRVRMAYGLAMVSWGRYLYFPSGLVFTVRVPLPKGVGERLDALVEATAADRTFVVHTRFRAALLVLRRTGAIETEELEAADLVVNLLNLEPTLERLRDAGLIHALQRYRPVVMNGPPEQRVHVGPGVRDEGVAAFTLLPYDPRTVSVAAARRELRRTVQRVEKRASLADTDDGPSPAPAYEPGDHVFIPGDVLAVAAKELDAMCEFCRGVRLDSSGDRGAGRCLLQQLLDDGRLKAFGEDTHTSVLGYPMPTPQQTARYPFSPWTSIVRVRLQDGDAPGLEVWTLDHFFGRPILWMDGTDPALAAAGVRGERLGR